MFLNGAKQIEGQDYDANNGSTFDVSGGGATNGDVIEAVAYKAFNVSNVKDAPGDFTVGNNLTVVGHTMQLKQFILVLLRHLVSVVMVQH